ncbi:hypothetical protein GOODEAATRI_029233, partial [Goodea atripinnis]
IPMSELNTLCTKLGVKCFIDREYQFLHEYCTFMKPLTAALDILQGRKERVKELLITECRTTAPAPQARTTTASQGSLFRQSQRRPTLQNRKSWATLDDNLWQQLDMEVEENKANSNVTTNAICTLRYKDTSPRRTPRSQDPLQYWC